MKKVWDYWGGLALFVGFAVCLVILFSLDYHRQSKRPTEYGPFADPTGQCYGQYRKSLSSDAGRDSRLCDLEQKVKAIDQILGELQKQAKNQSGERTSNDY